MRSKWKSRLAVSTVVANMLMILITLSLAAMLVAWAGTTYGAFTGGTQVFFGQRGQALQERFVIENVFFAKSQNQIRVFVRNVGVEEVKVATIYVNGTNLTPTGSGSTCTIPSGGLTMPVQQVCEFDLNWNSWVTGAIFNILVATARGNQASYTARGP
jgi:archaellum component FlaF (FlaF/FlaG flagellin family)